MALTLNGTSQYATISGTKLSANTNKWAIAFWFKPTGSLPSANKFLGGLARSSTSQRSIGASIRGDQANDPIALYAYNGSDNLTNGGGASPTALDTWRCVVIQKFDTGNSSTGRVDIYDNRTTVTTNSSAPFGEMTLVDIHMLGAVMAGASATGHFEGKIAHYAVWDLGTGSVLGSTDIADLISGVSPDAISVSPTYYRPLISGLTGGIGSGDPTTTGSPSFDSDNPLASAPTLTDVDTDETVTSTQAGVVFTGAAFGASQGSSTLKLKHAASAVSITLSPSAWSDTSITADIVRTSGGYSLPYGAITAEVETAAGAGTLAITHVPPDARSYVTLTSLATEGKRITAIGMAVGDQLEVTSVTGGAISDVTLNADGTFDNAIGVTSFTVRGWDATDGTLGTEGTQTVTDPDTTAPTGYSVAFTSDPVGVTAGFQFAAAEVGATYDYTITSSGGGTPVSGSGTVSSANQTISGIDVSGLGNGTLTVSVTLTDAASNEGSPATDTATKSVSPLINNVDGDNAVTAGQSGVLISLENFTETITGVTFGGAAAAISGQTVGASVTVTVPGNAPLGPVSVVVSGATESASLSGVEVRPQAPQPGPEGTGTELSIVKPIVGFIVKVIIEPISQ